MKNSSILKTLDATLTPKKPRGEAKAAYYEKRRSQALAALAAGGKTREVKLKEGGTKEVFRKFSPSQFIRHAVAALKYEAPLEEVVKTDLASRYDWTAVAGVLETVAKEEGIPVASLFAACGLEVAAEEAPEAPGKPKTEVAPKPAPRRRGKAAAE